MAFVPTKRAGLPGLMMLAVVLAIASVAMAREAGPLMVRGRRTLAAVIAAFCALPLAAPAHAGGDVTSGLPVPRFVSLKTDRVNVRGGPDKDHDVTFIYTRIGWPVEITAEFENWRRIRDSDGSEGWVYHSLLSGKRMAAVQLKSKTDLAAVHAKPDAQS